MVTFTLGNFSILHKVQNTKLWGGTWKHFFIVWILQKIMLRSCTDAIVNNKRPQGRTSCRSFNFPWNFRERSQFPQVSKKKFRASFNWKSRSKHGKERKEIKYTPMPAKQVRLDNVHHCDAKSRCRNCKTGYSSLCDKCNVHLCFIKCLKFSYQISLWIYISCYYTYLCIIMLYGYRYPYRVEPEWAQGHSLGAAPSENFSLDKSAKNAIMVYSFLGRKSQKPLLSPSPPYMYTYVPISKTWTKYNKNVAVISNFFTCNHG